MTESTITEKRLKKIVLVTCASNFERHKNIITAIHQKLKEMGGYIFYVLTNYGVYKNQKEFLHGEPAIYSFLDHMEIDGCILEANLGSASVMEYICEKLEKRGIPAISINIEKDGIPYIGMDSYKSGRFLIEHMIDVHHCRKVNLVLNEKESDIISLNMLKACRDVFKERGLEFDEARVYRCTVGIPNGRQLFHIFREDHTDDADVVITVHDILAIGYELELEKYGMSAPEDVLLCSLNRSANSFVFRPDITGVDRMDGKVASMACELLERIMAGEKVPMENYYSGEVSFGASCGCSDMQGRAADKVYQQIIITKVSAGDQVRSMMEFNGDLEDVDSIEQLADNIRRMMRGIGIASFFCCFNETV